MEIIPRWTLAPVPGVAEYEVSLPDGLLIEPAALKIAHAKVLGALSGEPAEEDPAVQVRRSSLSIFWED